MKIITISRAFGGGVQQGNNCKIGGRSVRRLASTPAGHTARWFGRTA